MYEAGLVLEGGGMRGMYTAGVLDFFMDNNLEFKNVYGVSAGACHGTSYVAKQRGRAFLINTKYLKDKRYASFQSLIKTGDYFERDFQLNVIPNELDLFDYESFRNSGVNYQVVATNCETGEAEYLRIKDLETEIDKLWASSTLPLLSKMVHIDGKKYLDGGIADSIPVEKALSDGNKKVIVVLTQDIMYKKKKSSLLPVIKLKYRNYPKMLKSIEDRYKHYNKTTALIKKYEKEGKIIVIRPLYPLNIGRIEKNEEKLKEIYKRGYSDASSLYKKIKTYLEN